MTLKGIFTTILDPPRPLPSSRYLFFLLMKLDYRDRRILKWQRLISFKVKTFSVTQKEEIDVF